MFLSEVNNKLHSNGSGLAQNLVGAREHAWATNISVQCHATTVSELEVFLRRLQHKKNSRQDVERIRRNLTCPELIWHYHFL
jgi:hypothetical protein